MPPATNSPHRPDTERTALVRANISLGRWAGVPVSAHWSTAATLALFAWLLAAEVLPSTVADRSTRAYWAVAVVTAVVFLGTLIAHELAHAVAARHYGMRVRSVTLWMLGGLTELDGDPPSARADAWIAAAGPLTSIAIGLLGGALAWVTGVGGLVGGALVWLAEMSVVLGVFNLLPGAPLDGGRLLRALLWRHFGDRARAMTAAARAGRALGIALIALGFLEALAGGIAGLWLVLIGMFVLSSSNAERDAAGLARLDGIVVSDIMSPVAVVAPSWWTVDQLLDEVWNRRAMARTVPVVDFAGELTGIVTLADLQRVAAAQRGSVRIGDICHRSVPALPPDAPVSDGVPLLRRAGVVLVTENRRPIGLVTGAEIAHAANLAMLRGSGTHAADEHRTPTG